MDHKRFAEEVTDLLQQEREERITSLSLLVKHLHGSRLILDTLIAKSMEGTPLYHDLQAADAQLDAIFRWQRQLLEEEQAKPVITMPANQVLENGDQTIH